VYFTMNTPCQRHKRHSFHFNVKCGQSNYLSLEPCQVASSVVSLLEHLLDIWRGSPQSMNNKQGVVYALTRMHTQMEI